MMMRCVLLTLVPIRPRSRCERRSLRSFSPGASLRPGSLAFNPRHRRLSTSTDAFQLHPDIRSYGTTLMMMMMMMMMMNFRREMNFGSRE